MTPTLAPIQIINRASQSAANKAPMRASGGRMRMATAMAPARMLTCSQDDPVSASGHGSRRSHTTPHAHNPWRVLATTSGVSAIGQ